MTATAAWRVCDGVSQWMVIHGQPPPPRVNRDSRQPLLLVRRDRLALVCLRHVPYSLHACMCVLRTVESVYTWNKCTRLCLVCLRHVPHSVHTCMWVLRTVKWVYTTLLPLLCLWHWPARLYVGVESHEMSMHEYGVCTHRQGSWTLRYGPLCVKGRERYTWRGVYMGAKERKISMYECRVYVY